MVRLQWCKSFGKRRQQLIVYTINKSAHTKKVWQIIACTSYIIYLLKVFAKGRMRHKGQNEIKDRMRHKGKNETQSAEWDTMKNETQGAEWDNEQN